MKISLFFKHLLFTLCIASAATIFITPLSAISSGATTITSNGKTIEAVTNFEGTATSFTQRSNDKFSIGYYIKDGNLIKSTSLLSDTERPVSNLDLDIVASGEAFGSVIATGKATDLTLTGTIFVSDNGDGKNASDFSGLGAQVIVSEYANVKARKMKIDTKGFMRAAFICDSHGQVLIEDSTITTLGANPLTQAYEGYVNSASQNKMLSPPWVLGIQGGIRAFNILGDKATLTVTGSTISSGGWAVLSTDACTSPVVNVVDSTLEILPASKGGMSSGNFAYSGNYGSGYGTYLIGNTRQYFYGTTFKGLTYASIFTNGYAYYQSSNGKIELKNADDEPVTTVMGKGRPTTIDAVWGFMTHSNASVNVLDGTVVNSEEAIFLCRASGAIFTVDNAILNSASGTLLQIIDNADRTVSSDWDGFSTDYSEPAGWPSENGSVTKAGASADTQSGMPVGPPSGSDAPGGASGGQQGETPAGPGGPGASGQGRSHTSYYDGAKLALTNGNYKGNVYNGCGYYKQTGIPLDVIVGKGATLTGAISLTETRHVDENGKQNTNFTINEYYYLGHVENRNYRNETSTLTVNLVDGGKWIVTGESLINELVVENGSIEGADGSKVVMKIDGKKKPIKTGETYKGNIVISLSKQH